MIKSSETEIPTTLQPSTEPTNSSSSKSGLIIGCVVAAVAIVAGLIVILWLCARRRKRARRYKHADYGAVRIRSTDETEGFRSFMEVREGTKFATILKMYFFIVLY